MPEPQERVIKERERSPYISPSFSQEGPEPEANCAAAVGRQLRLAVMEAGRVRGWREYHCAERARSSSDRGWAFG